MVKNYVKDKGQDKILDIYLRSKVIPKLLLCLAAPGTGKTTTIVRLLLALINLGMASPIKNFMVLTFTKRTRNDILKKFEEEGRADVAQRLERIVRNFHSLAFTSLFWEDILTDSDLTHKIHEIAQSTNGIDMEGKDRFKIKKLIKDIKQAISHNTVQETLQNYLNRNPALGNIMQAYIDWLEESYTSTKSISYDYALIKFIDNLQKGQNPFKIDLSKIQLLIIDQFQDSNPAQMKIVEEILRRNPKMKLLLMGDIDQTIYTWRGSDLTELDNFIRGYSEQQDRTKSGQYYDRVFLQNTHRLGAKVLKVSQTLIRSRDTYLRFRNDYYGDYQPKPLNIKDDHAPLVIQFQSEYSEVNWVIDKIRELVDAKNGINYKDITVLMRSFKFSRFFNKFKYQNTRLALKNKRQEIPFTLKTDDNHKNLQIILAWLVYFYKKKYFPKQSLKDEIKIILAHMKPTPKTLQTMIEKNAISKFSVSRNRLTSDKEHAWDNFFLDFNAVERILRQKQLFSEVFRKVYDKLTQAKRIQQLSQFQCADFIQYIGALQPHLNKQQLKQEPVFTIIRQVIRSNIYETKSDKQKKKKARFRSSKKKEKKEELKITNFFQLKQKQHQQMNQMKEQPRMLGEQSRQQIELQYTNQADAVQFQTVYKAKGLQYKVVFICSLNFDYKHEEYEPGAVPRKIQQNNRSDAERERQMAMDLNRFILKEEEELRVIYTAVTRTSKYCFVTASISDCYVPEFSVKHPHFETLFNKGGNNLFVPFEAANDIQFKEEYERQQTPPTTSTKKSKGGNQAQLRLDIFKKDKK